MIIYLVLWALLILPYMMANGQGWKNFTRNYAIYVSICLIVLIGCRHVSVGADTRQYEYLYSISAEQISPEKYDQGYYRFAHFFHQLGFSYQAYNFIVAVVLVSSLVLFYATYSKNTAFSTLVFMTIGLLPMYMSGTRQSLAISIYLLAVIWTDKHRKLLQLIVSILLAWLASTFHASAMVGFAAIALIALRPRLSRQSLFILVMIAAGTMVYRNHVAGLAQYVLPEKYMSYDLNADYQINPLLIIISILIPAFCLVFDTDVQPDGRFSAEKTWLYLFSCANILLTILAKNSMYFSRISYYFVHANSILISNMIVKQRMRTNSYIMYIVIGVICMLYFLISMPGGTLKIDNYMFFWQQIGV
ncbi:MAG: EpsG family protein [Clostridia bacterium]|nr:EpsG family protein [Clostridia bacterium]